MLALVGLGRRLLIEEGVLGQLLLKVHGVDGRLGGAEQQVGHEDLWESLKLIILYPPNEKQTQQKLNLNHWELSKNK